MDSPFERLFTVEEANALLPRLTELLAEVGRRRDALRERLPEVEEILNASLSNGGGRPGSEYGVEAYRLYLALESIRSLGVVPKDLDLGLLDFPHERDGRVVFLCWRPPEAEVAHWHDLDEGFPGRKPL